MKTITTITLDIETLVGVKQKKINVSQECNNYLRTLLELDDETEEPTLEREVIKYKALLLMKENELEKEKNKALEDNKKKVEMGQVVQV